MTGSAQCSTVYVTYLNFYAALSTEVGARAMHTLSVARLYALERAEYFFREALHYLPTQQPQVKTYDTLEIEQAYPQSDCSDDSDSTSSYDREHSLPSRSCSSPSSLESEGSICKTSFPRPPLRRLRRSMVLGENILAPGKIRRASSSQAPTPKPSQNETAKPPTSAMQRDPMDYAATWLQNRHIERYNSYLAEFSAMLANHLESVRTTILSTKEAQATKYGNMRMVSYGDDEEAKAADLRDRIQRLKATGWSRDRFDSSRYERLCEAALAEL